MRPSKGMIVGLLKQQLDAENDKTEQDILDDPDGWTANQENTAMLMSAIFLLEQHDWSLVEEE